MQDDQLLNEYVNHNSETAFATLVGRYSDLVYSTCLREVRNAELAQDVTQVVFLLLAKKASSFREGVVLAGWLFQTACFASKDAVKQEIRRLQREQKAAEEMIRDIQLEDRDLDWSEVEPELHRALGTLSHDDRNAVLLRFFQNKSLKATGESLGISEDAARMKVSRAVDKMRRHFKKRGFVLSAGTLTTYLSASATSAAPAACVGAAVALGKIIAAEMTGEAVRSGLISNAVNSKVAVLFAGVWRALMWSQVKTATAVVIGTALVGTGAAQVVQHVADRENAPSKAGRPVAAVPRPPQSDARAASRNSGRLASSSVETQRAALRAKAPQQGFDVARNTRDAASPATSSPLIPGGKGQSETALEIQARRGAAREETSESPASQRQARPDPQVLTNSQPNGLTPERSLPDRMQERAPRSEGGTRPLDNAPNTRGVGAAPNRNNRPGLTPAQARGRGPTEGRATGRGDGVGGRPRFGSNVPSNQRPSPNRPVPVRGNPGKPPNRPAAPPARPNPARPNAAPGPRPDQNGSPDNRSRVREAAQERARAIAAANQTYRDAVNQIRGGVRGNDLTPAQRDALQVALRGLNEAIAAADEAYSQAVGGILGTPS